MDYDEDKVDEVALALLYLSLDGANRAWKGIAYEISDRLYKKGWIETPNNQNKSLVLTPKGRELCVSLFKQYFGNPPHGNNNIESK
jgi:hypothetical protein